MAIFHGADAQNLLNAQTIGKHDYYRMASDLVVVKESYTLLATEAANDVIFLGREMPGGRIIIPALSTVQCVADPGTALIIDIGVNDVADNIADGLDCGTIGMKQPLGREVEIVSASRIKATVKTATTLTADVVLDFYFVCRQTS